MLLKEEQKELEDRKEYLSSIAEKEQFLIEENVACHYVKNGGTHFCVTMNDIFCCAADSTFVTVEEVEEVYAAYMEEGYSGIIKWASLKESISPMKSVLASLEKEGYDVSWVESLRRDVNNV